MGSINRFDLTCISKDYNAPYFFETGTFKGEGVAYALQTPFTRIISVEIIPALAAAAGKRFSKDEQVVIVEGDSVTAMQHELPLLQANCIFWLDAHFPGADAGLTTYDNIEGDEGQRLPLSNELAMIKQLRKDFHDVVIIDDLRIYEDGPYEKGNVPMDALPRFNRSLDFIYQQCGKTHFVIKSYLDEGYIILLPIPWHKRLLHQWFSITINPPSLEHYLSKPTAENSNDLG